MLQAKTDRPHGLKSAILAAHTGNSMDGSGSGILSGSSSGCVDLVQDSSFHANVTNSTF
jgi:hypothetical protein